QIKSGKTHVKLAACIVVTVIVIPKGGGSTNIVVFVATLLPSSSKIRRKAIGFRPSHASMKVNNTGHAKFVRMSYDRSSSTASLDRWARKCAVVSPDSSAESGDDL